MHLDKSYLSKYNLVGFSNYYENDKGEIINKANYRFISLLRDKGRNWQYYSLVNDNGKRVKVGVDSLVKVPYFEKYKISYSKETLEASRLLGLID